MSNETTSSENTEDVQQPMSVQQMLEIAIQTASDRGMSTSELLGIFYYYTHSIAESYREDALRQAQQAAASEG